MHRRGLILSVLTVLNFITPTDPAVAQWDWPEKAKNLKILPENTSAADLRKTMFGFVRSLGVRCSHCHVGEEGRPLSEFDFVSDEREAKRIARIMLQMVRTINEDHLAKIEKTGSPTLTVTCVTCHHGVTQPRSLADLLTEAYRNSGTDSAMAVYHQLRDRHYGGFAYDFRASSLDEVADNVSNMKKIEDALKFLRMNVEFYPASVTTHLRLANMYKLLGEKAQAIAAAEKVLQLAPNHAGAKKLLEELKK